MGVSEIRNVIEDYFNSCYVSSMEAADRILGIPMHGEAYSIVRLEVHRENAKRVTFHPLKTELI